MKNLAEAHRYINSYPRPMGLNNHSWNALKRLALKAWECYLEGKKFNHSINFMCKEFYLMIRTPDGQFIVPEHQFSYDPTLWQGVAGTAGTSPFSGNLLKGSQAA